MTITTFSSREFNQDTSRAKKATQQGPVFITDRGEAAHVLLSIADYRKLAGAQMSVAEALAQPDVSGADRNFDFDPPRARIGLKPADFSRCSCSRSARRTRPPHRSDGAGPRHDDRDAKHGRF